MNKLSWKPTNVEEAMKALGELLSSQEESKLVMSKKDDLILYHHGLGQWLRNNWDLWKGGALSENLKTLGFKHPDDMSQCLIEEYWARKNNQPSTLQEDIKKCAEYWEKNK